MENRRALIATCVAVIVGAPNVCFAYPVPTHEGLTHTLVQKYEKLRGDVFTSEQETAIVRGSNEEDDSFRFKYHFYDPINNRGLWGRLRSSKEWVNDQTAQGGSLNSWQSYFARPDDYTWDRAVFDYAYGDTVRAAEALGHVLHLIEDASVPAHVRNDAHGNLLGVGDPDTYEKYSGIFTKGDVIITGKVVPKTFSTAAEAFDVTARFTNENFVSDDTLFAGYVQPDKDSAIVKNSYAYHPTRGYRLAFLQEARNRKDGRIVIEYEYLMDDPTNSVSSDYWNVLSRHAVESGIGVIDLFFREVEKEKQTGLLKEKDLSPLKQRNKEISSGFSLVKAIYGSSLEQSDVEDLLNRNAGQAGAAALATSNNPPPQQNTVSNKDPAPQVKQNNKQQKQSAPKVLGASISPSEETTRQDSSVPSIPAEPQTSAPSSSASSSGGSGGRSPTQTTDTPSSSTLSLSILSPEENRLFATTSVTFTGTTSASSVVSAAYGSIFATTTTDSGGNWALNFLLSSGTTTVSFSAATSTETSATSTRTVVVDVTPPGAPDVSISECSGSFITTNCTIATTTVAVVWGSVSGATYYEVVKNGVTLATTTATSTASNINNAATTTFSVVAYKSNGLAATSTEKAVFVTTQPLLINEIAWAGTNASTEDEAIELRNMTNSILDLSHFVLTTPDGGRVIQLSGTAAAAGDNSGHDFFVVERNAEATTAGSPNAVTVNFTQLSDGGEQLLLQWGNGIATTTIDTTPPVAVCSGWCAGATLGSAGYSVQSGTTTAQFTMERKDNSLDGSLAASWHTADGYTLGAFDRISSVIYGTLGANNSNGNPSAGWFCSPDTVSISNGAQYTPTSSSCTYLMRAISTQANRYGDLYRGDVASSTIVNGHFLGRAYMSANQSDSISNPQIGEHFFIAIYEARVGSSFDSYPTDDNTRFRNYFTTGAGTPPHSNYFMIPWVYGP